MLDASNPIGKGGNEFDLKWENVKNKDGGPFMGPKRRFLADMEKTKSGFGVDKSLQRGLWRGGREKSRQATCDQSLGVHEVQCGRKCDTQTRYRHKQAAAHISYVHPGPWLMEGVPF